MEPGHDKAHGNSLSPSTDTKEAALTFPPPIVTAIHTRQDSGTEGHADAAPFNGENDLIDHPYKAGSMSSTAGSSIVSPIYSVDLEKGGLVKEARHTKHKRGSRDTEKTGHRSSHGSREDHRHHAHAAHISYPGHDETGVVRHLQEEKAVKILLYLSFPCVILSTLNIAWTMISLIITILTQPVRLCARRPTFGQQLGGLLGPALNLQLKCIYTPLAPHANEDTSYHPLVLVTVQMLSPFLSLGMMVAAWVVAVFWISSAVVGDPAGTDKRDDGRETALALRNWWERWLIRSIREP